MSRDDGRHDVRGSALLTLALGTSHRTAFRLAARDRIRPRLKRAELHEIPTQLEREVAAP